MNRFKIGNIVALEEDFDELEKIRKKLGKTGIRFSPNNINYRQLKESGIKEFVVEMISTEKDGEPALIRVADVDGRLDIEGVGLHNEYRFKLIKQESFELEEELFIL